MFLMPDAYYTSNNLFFTSNFILIIKLLNSHVPMRSYYPERKKLNS